MEKGLLLDRIALKCSHVAKGDLQLAGLIKSDLADAALPLTNEATVAAGDTANAIAFRPPQLSNGGVGVHDISLNLIRDRHAQPLRPP